MKKSHENLKIISLTILVHLFYLFLFPTTSPMHQNLEKKTSIRVVTKEFFTPQTQIVSHETKKEELGPQKALIPSYLPEKTPPKKKKVSLKKEAPKKKPEQVKQAPAKPDSKKILSNLDKNLGAISTKKTKAPPAQTKIEQPAPPDNHTYLETLSKSLRGWLILPEKGSVKLTITVQANGKIANIELLSSESEKNLEYLQKVLWGISLPPRSDGKDLTFTITFCDD